MTQNHCLLCGSDRIHRSRRRGKVENAITICGGGFQRCHKCNARFFQVGSGLFRVTHLSRLAEQLAFTALMVIAVIVLLTAVLWLGRSQPAAEEGLSVPLLPENRTSLRT